MEKSEPRGDLDFFIARQPILDRRQKCYAYELLFRSGFHNVFDHPDPDEACRKVISEAQFILGVDALTQGKRAFVNVTQHVLLEEWASLLPRAQTVIEVIETVEPTPEVVRACRKLKRQGYLIALDDFVYRDDLLPLVELADIIKVDFLESDAAARAEIIERFRSRKISFLAEKVETHEQFQEALELGYRYFQGYFFSRPIILQGKELPGFKLHYLRLLREIYKTDMDFAKLSDIIKQDVSISYKLLRHVNSAAYGLRRRIQSIREALVLLGEREVKKLTSLITITTIGKDRPEPLMIESVVRARFCELLASHVGLKARADDLFLLGMFSLIEAFVGRPMRDVLEDLPLDEDIKAALLGEDNVLSPVLDFAIDYSLGQWDRVSEGIREMRLEESEVPQLYLDAVAWAQESYAGEEYARAA